MAYPTGASEPAATDSTPSSSATPAAPSLASSVQTIAPEEKAAPPASAGTQATADKGDTAVVGNDAGPDASGNVPDKAKPDAAAQPAEGKTAPDKTASTAAPAAKADEEVVIGKDQILTADEITQKFPSSNKGLRAYAASVGERFKAAEEVLTVVENLGGQEGLGLLLEYADVLANPKATDKFDAMMEKFPHHRKAFANKVFWKEAENQQAGGSLDLLVKEISEKRFGKEQTLADVLLVMEAVSKGDIDLETMREKAELSMSAADRAERDRKAEEDRVKDERLSTLEKEARAAKDKDQADSLTKVYASITTAAELKWKPIAESLKMLPDKDDPQPVADYKVRHLYRLLAQVDAELAADSDYQALVSLAQEGQSETTSFKMKNAVVANKSRKFFERIANAEAPFFAAAIKGFNAREIANITNTPSEPTGAPSVATTAAARAGDDANLSDDERKEKRRAGVLATIQREQARVAGTR